MIDRVLTVSKSGWRSIGRMRDADLVLLGLATALSWVVAMGVVGEPAWRRLDSATLNLLMYLSSWILPFGLWTLVALARHRPESPFAFMREHLLDRVHRTKIAASLPLLLMLTVMMPLFSGIKGAIPLFNAYSWDQTFIDLDRSIHGTDAWLLLQPVLGYPIVTSILSQLYHLWILLIYLGGVWFAIYCPDTAIRRRFFFAYILMWSIGGVAMAIGFASVGPCFTERMLGIDTFTAQMDYLRTANQSYPVTVLVVQDELLRLYNAGDYGLGRGITAMPSMHVGLACLFWLAMRQIDRRLGWAFFAFFLIIMLGSVHLGYHYAVDGYASIALVAGLWWLGGKLIGPGAPMPVVKP